MRTIATLLVLYLFTPLAMKAQLFEKDTFNVNGKVLEITFIKHSSLIFSYDGHEIYIDPVSQYADYSQLPKADLILITHEHGDHFDVKAIEQLEGTNTRIILNPASQQKIGKGEAIKNGDKLAVDSYLNIEAVPAYNTTPDREMYHPRHRDNGYILTFGSMRIYVAGDTEDISEMTSFGSIDIAFLPVNQPYTMTPEQAANAARRVKPSILYPYHYGNTEIEELSALLKNDKDIDVRIRQLQ